MYVSRCLAPLVVAGALLCWSGCNDGGPTPERSVAQVGGSQKAVDGRQVNISILLDLSDRIEPAKYPASPSHVERDIAAVGAIVDFFQEEMKGRGAFAAKGKIRTIFSPNPESADINQIAQRLSIDLDGMQPYEKKTVYDSLGFWYQEGLSAIYEEVLSSKNYVGADIWRFFKEGLVKDYCVEIDPSFRNILVIVTDGYIYHDATRTRAGNRTTYVTGPYLRQTGLRNNASWRQKFSEGDYGLVDAGVKLEGVEVLVLEVNPEEEYPGDYELIQAYWGDWLDRMGVTRYRLVKSDLPVHTKKVAQTFLSGEA